MNNKIPIIYLVDSAGVFLPRQDEIFPDKDHFGRIFRNNAKMSSEGIIQISAVMGSCVAGGAYLPIMSDEAIIVNKTASIFLAGSYLVKAAIGEDVDNESLGGASTHSEISGIVDYKAKNDQDALNRISAWLRKLVIILKLGLTELNLLILVCLARKFMNFYPMINPSPTIHFKIIERVVDNGSIDEYKADYGKTLITHMQELMGGQ